jgi:hypothetical protein
MSQATHIPIICVNRTSLRGIVIYLLRISITAGMALAACAQASRDELLPVARATLYVTEGTISQTAENALAVNDAKMRVREWLDWQGSGGAIYVSGSDEQGYATGFRRNAAGVRTEACCGRRVQFGFRHVADCTGCEAGGVPEKQSGATYERAMHESRLPEY